LIIACQTPATSTRENSFLQTDNKRNVLSFADTLEPVLPSVVRIGRLKTNSEGEFHLSGLGSGAVIDNKNGYVITNAHVVNEGDNLRVGDVVFAVGYPLGLEQSLSLGVVSGLGRSSSRDGLQDFIQTDAAINSGNSGGPLLDSQGRLVGINTAIVSRSGGNNGIGFSVPTALATQVTDQLIRYGEVRRGSIGVQSIRVSEEASKIVGIDHWDGAFITNIRSGSPAERAGLKAGDVITAFDGKNC